MKLKRKVLLFIAALTALIGILGSTIYAEEINVYIDNQKIEFNITPEIINDRVMVPLRVIFEQMGAEVSYNRWNKTVTISKGGNKKAVLQTDQEYAEIDGAQRFMSAAPVIMHDTLFVSLRTAAEISSAEVSWDGDTKSVYINTLYPQSEDKTRLETFGNKHILSSYNKAEYMDFKIDGSMLVLTGKTDNSEITSVELKVNNVQKYASVKIEDEFTLKINLSECGITENSTILVYYSTDKGTSKMYWGTSQGITVGKDGDEYVFSYPMPLESNNAIDRKWKNPDAYLNSGINSELVKLSNSICKNAKTDYEKLSLINDWVADNIYYDYDAYYEHAESAGYSAYEVYSNRRGVCAGYSNLVQALVQAQGIPCRCICGYALGLSTTGYWNDKNINEKTNHQWNAAYVDHRWVNMDTTWDSGNKYEGGKYVAKARRFDAYFDITDVMFAYNHKIIE
ncbi:MAG: stalk domain-containing protein [Anaerotignum sp.]|nr:stalk domain-containing protein [Anaerotignum sp.]